MLRLEAAKSEIAGKDAANLFGLSLVDGYLAIPCVIAERRHAADPAEKTGPHKLMGGITAHTSGFGENCRSSGRHLQALRLALAWSCAASFPANSLPSCSNAPQDRRRLNHLDHTEQAWPQPGHPHQRRTIATPQRQTCRSLPQSDSELMTEKEDLGLKPPPRLEQVGESTTPQFRQETAIGDAGPDLLLAGD